jgi:PAS domain S-box-containing protein
MPFILRVLQVEDSEDDARLVLRQLRQGQYEPQSHRVETAADFLEAVQTCTWDLIIADYSIPGFGGLEALEILRQSGQDIPFILVSGAMGEEVAVHSMKAGAHDYVLKDNLSRLVPVVDRELREAGERRERKRAEAALRETEQRHRLHFLQTPLGVIEWNMRFEIMAWNPAAERIFGYTPIEAIGQHASLIIPGSTEKPVDALWQAMISSRDGSRSTSQNLTRAGQLIDCEWYNTPLVNETGQVIGAASLVQDVTEQRRADEARERLEAQLRQAQKVEAIGTLAGGIAHDFNNILAAIVAFAELARMDAGDNANVQDSLANLLKAAKRAEDLVRQILAFSRRAKQERKPICLNPAVKESLKLLRSALPSTIEIVTDIQPETAMVLADPTQVHQVVMNLCTNATHAMRGSMGRLTVGLQTIEVDETLSRLHHELHPGRYVRLEVQDTGHGMDSETLKRIFDPFFTTKAPGEGTGLGLAVVHGIVKEHEGAIQVESRPGHGTTFHVYFPAQAGDASAEGTAFVPLQRGQGEHILLVDDEVGLARAVERMLQRLGYQVTVRTDSKEALETFRARPDAFQLVITDLTMPGLTGIDLAGQMLQLRRDVPILLATGFSGTWTPETVRSLGIRDVILKPLNLELLSAILRRTLAPPA